jgi:hypothetical protein
MRTFPNSFLSHKVNYLKTVRYLLSSNPCLQYCRIITNFTSLGLNNVCMFVCSFTEEVGNEDIKCGFLFLG